MIFLLLVVVFGAGFLTCFLIQKDPEVVAEYKEKETFKEYAEATENLLKKVKNHDPALDLILILDSIAILSAYKRMPAMKLLQDQSTFKYNSLSKDYAKLYPFYRNALAFQRLRKARRQCMIAIRRIYR